MKYLIAILLMLISTASFAEVIPTHWGKMKAGSYIVYDGSQSGRLVMVYRGKFKGLHVVDLVPGSDPNGDRSARTYRDDAGNMLRKEFADGSVTRYAPHNCQRVVGVCSFVETGRDGRHKFEHHLEVTRGGFKYQYLYVYADGTKKLVGKGEVQKQDEYGIATKQIDAPPTLTADKLRVVQAVYR